MRATIALLPGDGIGPEVIDAAACVLDVVARRFDHDLTLTRHAVKRRCEQVGVELSRYELDRVYRAVIELADRQKQIDDHDVAAIVARIRAEQNAPAPARPEPATRTA
jgi:isocitrate/isopropylmalate dehydrogenase